MRANIKKILDAFRDGRPAKDATCRTDGHIVYSYSMPIARRVGGHGGQIYVIPYKMAPTATTRGHVRAVTTYFGAAAVESATLGQRTRASRADAPVGNRYKKRRKTVCAVCGSAGHTYKRCPHMHGNAALKTSGRLWRALGTIAHNRSFTPRELTEYAGVDGTRWVQRLLAAGMLTRSGRGHYYPTAKGWARIEGDHGDARRNARTGRFTR